MSKPAKPKFYVVWDGRIPGIYTSWEDASRQVSGYPKAKYKGFSSRAEAETAYSGNYWSFVGQKAKPGVKSLDELAKLGVILESVAVDAACAGVPGPMEYQGVDVLTGEKIFHAGPFEDGTNNIGEFLAIVEALQLLAAEHKPKKPIYSDSVNAQLWVRARTCRTQLQPTNRNGIIFNLIVAAENWLREHPVTNPILKWETSEWGEIPADFGRK